MTTPGMSANMTGSLITFGFELALHLLIGVGMAFHAGVRRRNPYLWALVGFLLGPLGAILWILFLVFWVDRP